MRKAMRQGFTLLEMLVTLILLGILVAIVFPVVTQQVEDAEPTKAANDLANIRTAIELFHLNIRPTFPGDIEDLAVKPDTTAASTDEKVSGTVFAHKDTVRWKGPYIDATVTSTTATDQVIETGFSAGIVNDLKLFDGTYTEDDVANFTAASANFVVVQVEGITADEFELINDLIDGEGEANGATSQSSGRFRFLDHDGDGGTTPKVGIYLAVPYTG